MKRIAVLVPLLVVAAPAFAQDPVASYAGYDRCLAQAAVQASQGSARSEEVFGLAKRQCAGLRKAIAKGPQMMAALDSADATKAAYYPAWVSLLRERRQGSLQTSTDLASR